MVMMTDVRSVGFEWIDHTDKAYHHIEAFDHTKLSAVNTCPTWGITRYGMHKTMPKVRENARSMALEAGQAAHDAFAAIRLASLQSVHPDHAEQHAVRIFGRDRGGTLLSIIRRADTIESAIRAVGVEALITSGFTDDPFDKRRTIANLEASICAYSASYDSDRWPVWVASERDPNQPVGIEQPFAVLMTFLLHSGEQIQLRLTGKVDGLHWNRTPGTEIILHDNKTGGRLDDAWAKSFDISHQVTGYVVAGSLFCGMPIRRAVIRGVQLPLPRLLINGLHDIWVTREEHHRERWIAWLLHTYSVYQQYRDDPVNAPKYSHSCNRYFRPCPLIPFCNADDAEQQQILSELVTDQWSPLAEEYDG